MVVAAEVASQPLDYTALATNVGILIGFVVAAVLGIKKGLDTFQKSADKQATSGRAHVAAAQLIENQTLTSWSNSNGEVADVIRELIQELHESRRSIYQLGSEVKELRHQVERVRDKM